MVAKRGERIYEMYKGERLLGIGTADELAAKLNMKRETILALSSESHKKRLKPNGNAKYAVIVDSGYYELDEFDGTKMRRIMNKKGVSVVDISEELLVSMATVNTILSGGQRLATVDAEDWAYILEVPVEDILTEKGKKRYKQYA